MTHRSTDTTLKALFINCTLKRSPRLSHTRGLIDVSAGIMQREGIATEVIRLVDHDVAPGVHPDMTEKGEDTDEWPTLFEKIIEADILVLGTPIWLGEKSSIAQRCIERLYSMSARLNDRGQYIFYGKVGGCIITGNEDGVKHCAMGILYSLQHIGYTIPPQSDCGWIGEVGPGPSYLDPEADARENDFTNRNATFMTYNLIHMASMLKSNSGIPAYGNQPEKWDDGERWAFQKIERHA